MKFNTTVELVALESEMLEDRPMVRATFACHECVRLGDCKLVLHCTQEEAESLNLGRSFKLELFNAN